MKNIALVVGLFSMYTPLSGQNLDSLSKNKNYRNYISVNIPGCLFQQPGITYEYRTKTFGFGFTAGYIYPANHGGTSILLGDWGPGTLGYARGLFMNPQFNYYFPKRWQNYSPSFYLGIKPIFKYAFTDSTVDINLYRISKDDFMHVRQQDNYYSYGAMLMLGFKTRINHFFFEIFSGLGWKQNIHESYVVAKGTNHPHKCAPYNSEIIHNILAMQFGYSFGVVF